MQVAAQNTSIWNDMALRRDRRGSVYAKLLYVRGHMRVPGTRQKIFENQLLPAS